MEILEDKYVIARKKHKCSLCNQTILTKEKYRRCTIVNDGIYTFKTHLSCEKLANVMNMYEYCANFEGLTTEYFEECIWNYFRDNYKRYSSKEKYTWQFALEFTKQNLGLTKKI